MTSKNLLRICWCITIFNLIVTPMNLIGGNLYVAIVEGVSAIFLVAAMIVLKKTNE